MKILDVLYNFYGDFDFIEEKYNEKYEGILIKIKEEQEYKRCRLAKKTPKKEGYFTVFWKKTKITRTFLILMKILGLSWLSLSSIKIRWDYLLFQKRWLFIKKILSTTNCNGKMSMRFYPPWCTNLNKTALATQKWQLQYFREIEI